MPIPPLPFYPVAVRILQRIFEQIQSCPEPAQCFHRLPFTVSSESCHRLLEPVGTSVAAERSIQGAAKGLQAIEPRSPAEKRLRCSDLLADLLDCLRDCPPLVRNLTGCRQLQARSEEEPTRQ